MAKKDLSEENQKLLDQKKLLDERDALLRRLHEIHRQLGVVLRHYGFNVKEK